MFHVKHFAEIFMNSTLDMKIKRNFRECIRRNWQTLRQY